MKTLSDCIDVNFDKSIKHLREYLAGSGSLESARWGADQLRRRCFDVRQAAGGKERLSPDDQGHLADADAALEKLESLLRRQPLDAADRGRAVVLLDGASAAMGVLRHSLAQTPARRD